MDPSKRLGSKSLLILSVEVIVLSCSTGELRELIILYVYALLYTAKYTVYFHAAACMLHTAWCTHAHNLAVSSVPPTIKQGPPTLSPMNFVASLVDTHMHTDKQV